jgi:transposase
MSRYDGRRYPSDLTDAQWAILEPLVPKPSTQGRPPQLKRRAIVNAILYVLRSGCPWRLLPLDFPAWQTVYYYFRQWQRDGVWDQMLVTLRMQMRIKQGRNPEPSAAAIDSQSIKTSPVRGPEKGYDPGEKSVGTQTTHPRGHRGQSVGSPASLEQSNRTNKGANA